MTIIEKIRRSFDWKITPPEPVIAETVAPPPRLGSQAALEKICGATLAQLEGDTQVSTAHGFHPGGVEEVRNAAGVVVNYRPKHFASAVEAGVAGKIAALEARDADPVVIAEARRLAPLARRWWLLRELKALRDVPVVQTAPKRAVSEPASAAPVEAAMSGYDNNLRSLRASRFAAEQDARDFAMQKYDRRNSLEALAGRPAPDPNDVVSQRVSLIVKLAEWADKHAQLAGEIAAFERTTA